MMIIKYYEWMNIFPDKRQIVYEQCVIDPQEKDGVRTLRRLEREKAMELIEENDLQIVHRNRHGTIWRDI